MRSRRLLQMICRPGISGDCRYYLRTDLEQLSTTMIDSNEIEVKAVINLNAVVLARQEEEIIDEIREEDLDMEKLQSMPRLLLRLLLKVRSSVRAICR